MAEGHHRGKPRRQLNVKLFAVFILVAAVALYSRARQPSALAAAPEMAARRGLNAVPGQFGRAAVPFDLILGMTHHKSGTSQMGCLLYHFAYALNTSTPVYQDNFVLFGNINMHMARTPRDDKRPLAFLTGHELMKQCYYQNATKHWVVCPNQFPCKDGKPMLGIADCFVALPAVNLGMLHFIRNPLDIVTSAYLYHTQDPPPEKWIETMKLPNYLPFLEKRGVPLHRLAALGMSKDSPADQSYGQLLRSLPPERGVHLEFWRTVPMLYGMAQQYVMLGRHPSAMQVRFEDLRFRFNATVRGIAEQLYAPYDPEVLLAAAQAAQCDPGTWTEERRGENQHITWGKEAGRMAALRGSLLKDKSIRRHLCLLQHVLGYPQEAECDGEGAVEQQR